jgi:hypothetical protein
VRVNRSLNGHCAAMKSHQSATASLLPAVARLWTINRSLFVRYSFVLRQRPDSDDDEENSYSAAAAAEENHEDASRYAETHKDSCHRKRQ